MFEGSMTALVTPFKRDGSIDEEGLRELVEFQCENGTDVLVPSATTGESATMSGLEQGKVIKIVLDQASVKVIAGAGTNDTQRAVELTRQALDLGADGVLSVCPYYNKPTQRGIYEHFKAVARVDIPVVIYNVPGRTSCYIEAETILKLAEIPNIVGLKEASGNISHITEVLEKCPKDFSVLSGDDPLTYSIMCLGGRGAISVASNLVPREVSEMIHLLLEGEYKQAREIHFRLIPLFRDLFIETNPIPVKEALKMMGRSSGSIRLPLFELEDENRALLRNRLKGMGLI